MVNKLNNGWRKKEKKEKDKLTENYDGKELLLSSSENYLKIILMQQNNNFNYKKEKLIIMNSSYTIRNKISSLILIEIYIKLIQLIIILVMQKQQQQKQIIIKININKTKIIHKMQIKQNTIQINYYDNNNTLFSNSNHNNKLLLIKINNGNIKNQQKHININIITFTLTLTLNLTLNLNLKIYYKQNTNSTQHPMDNEIINKNYYNSRNSDSCPSTSLQIFKIGIFKNNNNQIRKSLKFSSSSLDSSWNINYYYYYDYVTHAAGAVVAADFAADIGNAIIEKQCSRIFLE